MPLEVSSYKGTAGDALIEGSVEEGTEYTSHTGMRFSTFDRDADKWEDNCAEVYGEAGGTTTARQPISMASTILAAPYDPQGQQSL